MELLLQLQNSISFLNPEEVNQLLNTFSQKEIIQIIFDRYVDRLKLANNIHAVKNELISLNETVESIICSRDESDSSISTKTDNHSNISQSSELHNLPNEMISNIASFLTTQGVLKFEKCCKTILISIRASPMHSMEVTRTMFSGPFVGYLWNRFHGISSASMDIGLSIHLQWSKLLSIFQNLHTLILFKDWEYWEDCSFKDWGDRTQSFKTNDFCALQSILNNIKKIDFSIESNKLIGFHPDIIECRYFYEDFIPNITSLTTFITRKWFQSDALCLKSFEWRESYFSMILKQNLRTLTAISFISEAIDDDYFYNTLFEEPQYFYDDLFTPMRVVAQKCLLHPGWTKNVLNNVEFKVKLWIPHQTLDFDMKRFINISDCLATLLHRNNVLFSFTITYGKTVYFEREPDISWVNDGWENQIPKLKLIYGKWEYNMDDNETVTFTLNNDILHRQTCITDYFLPLIMS